MINYDLFLLLREGNEKEFIKELKNSYDETIKTFENCKIKYQECRKQMQQISKKIFEEKEYCLNPEAPMLMQINTKLKTDPQSLRLYEQYRNYDSEERLYTERLWRLRDELMSMNNILMEYGINNDKEILKDVYS
jgi:murein L,D-transpeptidase YafK